VDVHSTAATSTRTARWRSRHDGDIKNGSTVCSNEMFANRLELFNTFKHPLRIREEPAAAPERLTPGSG